MHKFNLYIFWFKKWLSMLNKLDCLITRRSQAQGCEHTLSNCQLCPKLPTPKDLANCGVRTVPTKLSSLQILSPKFRSPQDYCYFRLFWLPIWGLQWMTLCFDNLMECEITQWNSEKCYNSYWIITEGYILEWAKGDTKGGMGEGSRGEVFWASVVW